MYWLCLAQQPSSDLDCHAVETSRTRTVRPTPGRALPYESSLLSKDLSLHSTQQTQETNIHSLSGFETAIPALQELQTYALKRLPLRSATRQLIEQICPIGVFLRLTFSFLFPIFNNN